MYPHASVVHVFYPGIWSLLEDILSQDIFTTRNFNSAWIEVQLHLAELKFLS